MLVIYWQTQLGIILLSLFCYEIINLSVSVCLFVFLFSEPGPERCLWVSPASFGNHFQGCYCAPHRTGCNSFNLLWYFFLWIKEFFSPLLVINDVTFTLNYLFSFALVISNFAGKKVSFFFFFFLVNFCDLMHMYFLSSCKILTHCLLGPNPKWYWVPTIPLMLIEEYMHWCLQVSLRTSQSQSRYNFIIISNC